MYIHRKNTLKQLLILLFTLGIIFIFNNNEVYAKSYHVYSANYNINIQDDGSTLITEKYDVKYYGDYTRFYREFPNNSKLPAVEQTNYSGPEIESVKINGIQVHETKNTVDRPNNTYGITVGDNGGTQLEFYYHADSELCSYEVVYTLDNFVKVNKDTNDVLFCYRVVPANFEFSIDKLNITITGTGVDSSTYTLATLPDNDYHDVNVIDNNTIEITQDFYPASQLFRVTMTLDKSAFDLSELTKIAEHQVKSAYNRPVMDQIRYAFKIIFQLIGPFLIIPLVLIIALSLWGIGKVIKYFATSKFRKALDQDPTLPDKMLNKISELPYTLVVLNVLRSKKYGTMSSLRAFFISLKLKGIVNLDTVNNRIEIVHNYYSLLTPLEAKTLEDMCNLVPIERTPMHYYITHKSLTELINNTKLPDILKNLENAYHMELEQSPYNTAKYEEAVEFLDWYLEHTYYNKENLPSTYDLLKSTESISTLTIYATITLGQKVKQYSDKPTTEPISMADTWNNWIDTVYISNTSSSSCSGCSSCSSCGGGCGGCSGGGAD